MTELWLERLATTGIIVLAALVVNVVVSFTVRRAVRVLSDKAERRRDGVGSRARRLLAKAGGSSAERYQQRVRTVGSMVRNICTVFIFSIALVMVLDTFGISTSPILASAGIGGVALGIGAQSLVKDYLSGICMLAEDQFGVGDSIKVGAVSGVVQEVTLRITKVRDASGVVWYLRNGEVLTLGNVSQGYSTATVEVPVAVGEDPDRVQEILAGVCAELAAEEAWAEVLLEDPTLLGVDSITASTMLFKISLKTGPEQQWAVSRELRARVCKALTAAGVRTPTGLIG